MKCESVFMFDSFILMNPWPVIGTLGTRQEYPLAGAKGHHRGTIQTHIYAHLMVTSPGIVNPSTKRKPSQEKMNSFIYSMVEFRIKL